MLVLKRTVASSIVLFFLSTVQVAQADAVDTLVARAQANYPSIHAAEFNTKAAKQEATAAKRGFLPAFGIQAEPASIGTGDSARNPYAVVTLTQPIFGGGTYANYKRSLAQVEVTRWAKLQTRQEVGLRVVNAFGEFYTAHMKALALIDSLYKYRALKIMIDNRQKEGVASLYDVRTLESRQQQSQGELIQYVSARNTALRTIAELVGERSETLLTSVLKPFNRPEFNDATIAKEKITEFRQGNVESVGNIFGAGIPSFEYNALFLDEKQKKVAPELAVLLSPSIHRLEAESSVTEQTAKQNKAQLFPQISIQAREQFGDPSDANAGATTTAGIVVGYDSKNGFSSLSTNRAAQERFKSAYVNVDSSRRDLRTQVAKDVNDFTFSQLRAKNLYENLKTTAQLADSNWNLFNVGRKSWLDLVNSVREVYGVASSLVDERTQRMVTANRLKIYLEPLEKQLELAEHPELNPYFKGDPSPEEEVGKDLPARAIDYIGKTADRASDYALQGIELTRERTKEVIKQQPDRVVDISPEDVIRKNQGVPAESTTYKVFDSNASKKKDATGTTPEGMQEVGGDSQAKPKESFMNRLKSVFKPSTDVQSNGPNAPSDKKTDPVTIQKIPQTINTRTVTSTVVPESVIAAPRVKTSDPVQKNTSVSNSNSRIKVTDPIVRSTAVQSPSVQRVPAPTAAPAQVNKVNSLAAPVYPSSVTGTKDSSIRIVQKPSSIQVPLELTPRNPASNLNNGQTGTTTNGSSIRIKTRTVSSNNPTQVPSTLSTVQSTGQSAVSQKLLVSPSVSAAGSVDKSAPKSVPKATPLAPIVPTKSNSNTKSLVPGNCYSSTKQVGCAVIGQDELRSIEGVLVKLSENEMGMQIGAQLASYASHHQLINYPQMSDEMLGGIDPYRVLFNLKG